MLLGTIPGFKMRRNKKFEVKVALNEQLLVFIRNKQNEKKQRNENSAKTYMCSSDQLGESLRSNK